MRSAILLAAIVIAGLSLSWQGWRARGPDQDVMSSMVRTAALVERGRIPQRGNLTDHNSFRPPGLSWLLVPGVVAFDDPRRIELTGTGLLYAGTAIGVFMLARLWFGSAVGLTAAALYAASAIGIYLASTLQPKAHPFFCVWMIYCAARWIAARDVRWLAAAAIVCAAGTYVHVEMIAFAPIIPVAWWITRAPVTTRAVALAVAAILLMWSPYLVFQSHRGFVDLESQLLLKRIDQRGPEVVPYCGEEPTASPMFVDSPRDHPGAAARVAAMGEMALMNFQTRVPAGDIVLLVLLAAALLAPFMPRLLVIAIVVPAAIVLPLTEPGVPRLLGIWPLELIAITALVMTGGARLGWRRSRIVSAMMLVAMLVAVNGEALNRMRQWPSLGWGGLEPSAVEADDFRTSRCDDTK